MAAPKLTLYVDTVSPFAYEAYWILRNDPTFQKCEIEYVPVFLGGIMKACGNTAPINIKNKDKWINVERLRWARQFGVPMKEEMPEGFPPLTLGVMRAFCALTALKGGNPGAQEVLKACLDRFFGAFWVEHRMVNEPAILKEVLEGVLGVEVTRKVLEMASKEGKETLLKNTNKALEEGAFGLPWFVAVNEKGEKECFWGVDHLGQVVRHLGLGRGKEEGWKSVL